MVAAEADQRIARLHRAADISLNQIPWIAAGVETNVAMVDKSARCAEIYTGFAPHAVGVGMQFPAEGASAAPFMKEELSSWGIPNREILAIVSVPSHIK
jgi:hypothetical protein